MEAAFKEVRMFRTRAELRVVLVMKLAEEVSVSGYETIDIESF